MSARRSSTRRGQPVVALVLILGAWVGMRSVVWAETADEAPPVSPNTATKLADTAQAKPSEVAAGPAVHMPNSGAAVWSALPPAPAMDLPRRFAPVAVPVWPDAAAQADPGLAQSPRLPATDAEPSPHSPRVAAGHQLLYLAALAQLPMPVLDSVAGTGGAQRPAPAAADRRWSGDAWLLLRRGGNGFNLPGAGLPGANLPSGAYGASQAGAVIRYRLAPTSPLRPSLYLRATTAMQAPRGEELAAGFSARPLARVPVTAMVEVRATRTLTGTVVRPAAALVSEFPPVALPFGLRGEAYVQGGYVGGRDGTAFVDGQGRLERRLVSAGRWQLRAGAGTWGGAQKGAKRLDFGPTATLAVPLGPVGGRIAADWRFRVAGNAAPTSGPAITLSAGF